MWARFSLASLVLSNAVLTLPPLCNHHHHQQQQQQHQQTAHAVGAASSSTPPTEQHDTLRIAGAAIMYVQLPGGADAPELMRSRLRAIDQGRTQFRQRVRKAVPPKPTERLAPLVSSNVTEAAPDQGTGLSL